MNFEKGLLVFSDILRRENLWFFCFVRYRLNWNVLTDWFSQLLAIFSTIIKLIRHVFRICDPSNFFTIPPPHFPKPTLKRLIFGQNNGFAVAFYTACPDPVGGLTLDKISCITLSAHCQLIN
jgi:hypothetical protein